MDKMIKISLSIYGIFYDDFEPVTDQLFVQYKEILT